MRFGLDVCALTTILHFYVMMSNIQGNALTIEWSEEKNRILLQERGVSFEMVVEKIADKKILSDSAYPNSEKYPHQRIFIVVVDGYCYVVPYVQDETKIFLKTIYPGRAATKKYLRKEGK